MLTSAPRIFLVEDNPSDRVLTHERLRDRGLELLGWADTAQGGADRLAGVEADCVLVDLTLPDAQGTEAVKRLLEAAGGAAIIVLSGDPRQSAAISALRQGATDFVSKDASADTLAHAVREAVGAVRYERRLAAVEERRREAEDRFRVAFEHAPI